MAGNFNDAYSEYERQRRDAERMFQYQHLALQQQMAHSFAQSPRLKSEAQEPEPNPVLLLL